MTGGIEFTEAQELSKETPEVAEAQISLDRATVEPEAAVEKTSDFKEAEELEKEVVAAVEAAPKLETPPTVTLEGAGAEGKVTITEAAEPAAIIDSNDGSSTVNTGPDMSDVAIIDTNDGTSTVGIIDSNDREVIIDTNDGAGKVSSGANMDDVLIIDSNDGTSTVGIIDSNDGISAEAIIDTNDTTNRETIGTWPTPETGEQTDKAERENPPPLTDGGDPVSPAHDPVQEVSVADTGTSQIEYDTEMSETIAAETAIGQDELKAGEYGFHFEISGDTPDTGEFSRADVSTVEVDVGVGITTTADDTGQLAGVEADASTAKTIGTEASQGSGIPIDEEGDTADGASPGGLEVGSLEEVDQELPETGEPTPVDESSSVSNTEDPTGVVGVEENTTHIEHAAVQTTQNITPAVSSPNIDDPIRSVIDGENPSLILDVDGVEEAPGSYWLNSIDSYGFSVSELESKLEVLEDMKSKLEQDLSRLNIYRWENHDLITGKIYESINPITWHHIYVVSDASIEYDYHFAQPVTLRIYNMARDDVVRSLFDVNDNISDIHHLLAHASYEAGSGSDTDES